MENGGMENNGLINKVFMNTFKMRFQKKSEDAAVG